MNKKTNMHEEHKLLQWLLYLQIKVLHSYFEIDSIETFYQLLSPITQIQFINVTKIALQCNLIFENLMNLKIGVDPMFYKDHPQYLTHN